MLLVKQLVQPQLAKNKVKLIFSCLKCSIVTTSGEFLLILASFGFWIETASRPPSSISVFSRLKLTKRDYFILDLERNWRNGHLSRVEHFHGKNWLLIGQSIRTVRYFETVKMEIFNVGTSTYSLGNITTNLETSFSTWKQLLISANW